MEWTERVRAKLNDVNIQDSLRVAARSVIPEMRKRIFEAGETPEGDRISNYSTKATYISKSQMRRTGLGQATRGGKSQKFPGGYAEYKRQLNSTGNFDLRNFGVMQRDFQAPAETVSGNRLTLNFKEERNKIIAGNYPQAFGMSAAERDIFNKVFTDELSIRILS